MSSSAPEPNQEPSSESIGSPAEPPVPAGDPPRREAPRRRPGPTSGAARIRRLHAALAPLVLAPLLVTVLSGMSYRLLRDWGGVSRDGAHLLMVVHEGEWLRRWFGPHGETLYVLLNGLGLLWMLTTGGAMVWQRLRREWGGGAGGAP